MHIHTYIPLNPFQQPPLHTRRHLHPPAVTQVLKSSCLKLARLPAVRPHPLALESLAKGLKAAGMDSELKPLAPYLPEGLRAELLGEVEEEGREEGASSSKRPRRGAAAPEQPPAQAAQQQRRDPRQQLRGVVVGQGVGGQQPQQEQQQPPPPELMAVPPRWYKTNAPGGCLCVGECDICVWMVVCLVFFSGACRFHQPTHATTPQTNQTNNQQNAPNSSSARSTPCPCLPPRTATRGCSKPGSSTTTPTRWWSVCATS